MSERFILVTRHLSEGGGAYMEADSGGDWVLYSDLAAAHAEIKRLNDALANAAAKISDLATRLGQAEGRLAASEMAGVVEGWRDKCQRMEAVMAGASHPDFIWGALDNVHDAETTLDDYAAAVSRAIRGQMEKLK